MSEEQIRAEFEAWWRLTLLIKHEWSIREIATYCERSPDGDYVHTITALRWDGWKAGIAHQASDERVRELEKDAARYRWLCENKFVRWLDIVGFNFDADTGIDEAIDKAMKIASK